MSALADRSRPNRPQPPQQPMPAAGAFADAAAFLERIGAGGWREEASEYDDERAALNDGSGGGQHRRPPLPPPPPPPQHQPSQPTESLGRRLRKFLLRPRRRRQSSASATVSAFEAAEELQDYEYTRWVFHRRWRGRSPERSVSHDAIAADAAAAAAAATAAAAAAAAAPNAAASGPGRRDSGGHPVGSGMTKSASARIVRFRCPYDSVSSSDQDSTLVSPYLTSAFPSLLPPGGSVSSGYSSDRETPLEGAATSTTALPSTMAADAAHWVTREEDIDCLLRRPAAASASTTAATVADPGTLLPDDLEVGLLDVSAFFFGQGPSAAGEAAPPVAVAAAATACCGSLLRRMHPPPLPEPPTQVPQRHKNLQQWQLQNQHRHIYDPVAADEIDRLVSDVVRLGGGASSGSGTQRRSWGSWQPLPHHQRLQRQPQQQPQQMQFLLRQQVGWQQQQQLLSNFATTGPQPSASRILWPAAGTETTKLADAMRLKL